MTDALPPAPKADGKGVRPAWLNELCGCGEPSLPHPVRTHPEVARLFRGIARKVRSGCSCSWESNELGGRSLTERNKGCGEHGDDTRWWRLIVDRAAVLAEGRAGA